MDVNLDETELQVQETFARFFTKECPPERVRASEPLGFDAELWRQVVDLGAITMTLPESAGGEGGSLLLAALASEQLGRAVAPVPMLESIAATRLLGRHAGASKAWLSRIVQEGAIVTLALRPFRSGVSRLVPGGAVADAVVGMNGDQLVLCGLTGTDRRAPMNLGTSPIADCWLSDDQVVLCEGEAAKEAFEGSVAEWKILMAAALTGMAGAAFDLVLQYVKERKAFDVVLGAFQTIAHRLADSVVEIDGARFLAREAAWVAVEAPELTQSFAAAALAFCAEAAYTAANHAVHMHGGVGYTMEHDAQLYYRRARGWPLLYGDPAREYLVVADEVFGERSI